MHLLRHNTKITAVYNFWPQLLILGVWGGQLTLSLTSLPKPMHTDDELTYTHSCAFRQQRPQHELRHSVVSSLPAQQRVSYSHVSLLHTLLADRLQHKRTSLLSSTPAFPRRIADVSAAEKQSGREDSECCGREAQCGRRTKRNWTKTAHNTRGCTRTSAYITFTPLCDWGLNI